MNISIRSYVNEVVQRYLSCGCEVGKTEILGVEPAHPLV